MQFQCELHEGFSTSLTPLMCVSQVMKSCYSCLLFPYMEMGLQLILNKEAMLKITTWLTQLSA